MNKQWTAFLLAATTIAGTVYAVQPASADHYYRHIRNNEMKAARQQADANFDYSTGRFGRAEMHERKAFRDENRAMRHAYGY